MSAVREAEPAREAAMAAAGRGIRAEVTTEPIDPSGVLASVGDPRDGAIALFVGVVRNSNEGRPVSGMEYEGYAEMASEQLAAIAAEAAEAGGTDRVAVVHRLGVLAVGEPSVAIAVSTPHRAQAFDAARHVIEQIKLRLPVWKREHYLDRQARWLDGQVPAAAGADAG